MSVERFQLVFLRLMRRRAQEPSKEGFFSDSRSRMAPHTQNANRFSVPNHSKCNGIAIISIRSIQHCKLLPCSFVVGHVYNVVFVSSLVRERLEQGWRILVSPGLERWKPNKVLEHRRLCTCNVHCFNRVATTWTLDRVSNVRGLGIGPLLGTKTIAGALALFGIQLFIVMLDFRDLNHK